MPLKGFTAHFIVAVFALAAVAQTQSAQTVEAERAETLYQKSLDLSKNAYYAHAHANLFEAVNLWQKSGRSQRAIEALTQSADRHKSEGQWQYAIECFRRLLDLNAAPPRLKVSALNSLAQLYFDLRQFDLALASHRESLKLAERTGDRNAQALSLTGLASVYAEQGEISQARSYLDRAGRLGGNKKIEADALRLIGHIYYAQRRYNQAREAMGQALDIYHKMGEKQEEAQALCSLSNVLLAIGRKQDALERANEALSLWGARSEQAWRGRVALARAQRALAQLQEAHDSFYRAYGIIEKQAFLLSVDSLKISFMEERQAAYRELGDLLIELGSADEALLVIEHARSRSTMELLAGAKRRELSPEQKKDLQEISQKIASLNIELRSAADERRRVAIKEEIKECERKEHSIGIGAQMKHLKHFARPYNLEQLQKEVLKPDEVLLEFALTETRSHAWLVTTEKMLTSPLPARSEIDQVVRQYLDALSKRPSNLHLDRDLSRQKESAGKLFNTLLGAFKNQLPRDCKLIIVADGPLHYLPFETLVSDGRYLIEDHIITYMPSASVLGVLRQRAAREGAYPMELLAFGDPVLSSKAGGLWVSGGYSLPPLPNTRDEVTSISQMFPSTLSRVYLGQMMKEETIKGESLRLYRRLHLATHGLADERLPSRSAVVFALDDDPTEDGFLTVDEIADLELDCETVVLSACQTGRGRVWSGEGLVGLARSFLFAGARSAVVSLWNVSDISSSEFMKGLYRSLAAKAGGAASLRQAKLELMAKGKAMKHPYYWAPFVIVGP